MNDGPSDVIQAEDVDGDPIEYYIPDNSLGSDMFSVRTMIVNNITGVYVAELYFKEGVMLDREVCRHTCTYDNSECDVAAWMITA